MYGSIRRLLPCLLALSAASCAGAPPAGTCVVNADCAFGLVCIAGACLEAPRQPSCQPGRLACNADEQCPGTRCVDSCCEPACSRDADCPGGVCRGGACRPRDDGRCELDKDCAAVPGKPWCYLARDECVQCLRDNHCPPSRACGLDRECHPLAGCQADADCAELRATPKCDRQYGRCVACLAHADCSTDGSWICNSASKTCETPATGCASDAACAATEGATHCLLSAGRCVQCGVDDHCSTEGAAVCDTALHLCRPCRDDPDCARNPSGKRCRTRDRRCVRCLSDSDCLTGSRCLADNTCGSYRTCASDADCGGLVCRLSDHACVECLDDGDCGLLFKCQQSHCVLPSFCTSDAECAGTPDRPRCSGGWCVQCASAVDCGGAPCNAGTCGAGADPACPAGTCPSGQICAALEGGPQQCRPTCEPWAVSQGCTSDRRCLVASFDAAGRPRGACVPARAGGAALGAACSASAPCDYGLYCIPEGAGTGRCRRPCDPAAPGGACAGGQTCQSLVVLDAKDVPRVVGACYPPSKYLDPCASDAACDVGQVCAAGPSRDDPTTLANVCEWPGGAGAAAAACRADSDCRSGECLEAAPTLSGKPGFCQGACERDTQCPARSDGNASGACVPYPFAWHDSTGAAKVVHVPTCAVQCREEYECATGDTCLLTANLELNAWRTRCAPGRTGREQFLGGAACTSGADCFSGLCLLVGGGGRCLGVCGGPSGAANCAGGAVCPPAGVVLRIAESARLAVAKVCWGRTCTKDADCGSTDACGADPDPANFADIVLTCRPSRGGVMAGGSCAADADCRSGACIAWPAGKRCFGGCSLNTDCASGTTCRTMNWTNGGKVVRVCAP